MHKFSRNEISGRLKYRQDLDLWREHVPPDLWARIIGRASLSVAESLLYYFRNVQITQFRLHVFEQKDVGALHVTVEYLAPVEGSEAPDDLDEYVPDFLLLDVGLALLVSTNLLEYITVVSKLHY